MTSINFNNGGGFFSYYLGIAQYIYENYILDDCVFYCTSAGVCPCLCLAFNIKPKIMFYRFFVKHLKETDKLFTKAFLNWKSVGKKYWEIFFDDYIYDDIFNKNKNNINIQVYDLIKKKSFYKNDFCSKNEMLKYVYATFTIPFILTKISDCYEYIDGRILIDGGFGFHEKQCDINIHAKTFGRGIKNIHYWPTSNLETHIKSYMNGYNDAKNNPKFFRKLKLKSKI